MKKPMKTAAPSKAVIPVKKNEVALLSEFDSGDKIPAGFENVTSKDLLIPRITILQALSPQLKKKAPEYIEGAAPGMFCDVGTQQIFEDELLFLPCYFVTQYIEWAPRNSGKGFQFAHLDPTIMAKTKVVEDEEGRKKNMLANGNYIQETAQYYGLNMTAKGRRSFIPLSSTGLKSHRLWLAKIQAERLPRTDGTEFQPPMYYRSWTCKISEQTKGKDDWFGWQFEPGPSVLELDPTKKLLHEVKEFYAQCAMGNVRGVVEVEEDENTGSAQGRPM